MVEVKIAVAEPEAVVEVEEDILSMLTKCKWLIEARQTVQETKARARVRRLDASKQS